jgi:hypothetical protein
VCFGLDDVLSFTDNGLATCEINFVSGQARTLSASDAFDEEVGGACEGLALGLGSVGSGELRALFAEADFDYLVRFTGGESQVLLVAEFGPFEDVIRGEES